MCPAEPTLPARVGYDPSELGPAMYPLLTSVVVPRPIAWVSSRSAAGIDNLAPHSFFTVAGVDPPVVSFTSVGTKDTLRNIRETAEFVVHVATEGCQEAMNICGTDYPPTCSEFDEAALTREPSLLVAPSRVAEAPVALECRLAGEHAFGRCTVVFGEVLHVAVHAGVLRDGVVDISLLRPLARLGGAQWSALGTVFALRRFRYADWDAAGAAS